jgi:hypothetical protein
MRNDYFVNLIQLDWTGHNLSVLKYCKDEAEKAVSAMLGDYQATKHHSTVRGVLLWDRLDHFFDMAAKSNLFHGITSHWIEFKGAQILELRGKYSSLTSKHVLTRDDDPDDSDKGYRENNRAKNQKNLELFKEYEAPDSDKLFHIVFLHGGRNDNFGFLRIYLEDHDSPVLSENIMLIPSPEPILETEAVPVPTVTLKDTAPIADPISAHAATPELIPTEADDDGGQS